MSYRRLIPLLALAGAVCVAEKPGDDTSPTGGDTDSGDPDSGDTAPPGDTDPGDTDGPDDTGPPDTSPKDTDSGGGDSADSAEDTGPPPDTEPEQEGLLVWEGAASVVESWVGTEEIVLRDNLGLGDVACQIRYEVTGTTPAKDCEPCTVAFSVRLGAPEVLVADHCEDVGYDAATIKALEGEERLYGVALNYLGHANVLMLQEGGEWGPVAYVSWNEESGSVEYTWDHGYWTY